MEILCDDVGDQRITRHQQVLELVYDRVLSRSFPCVFESVLAVVTILRLLGPFPTYLYPSRKQKHVLDVSIVREHPVHGRWHVLPWI